MKHSGKLGAPTNSTRSFPAYSCTREEFIFFCATMSAPEGSSPKRWILHPGYAAAHEYFGDVCQMSGMPDEAIVQWRAALALSGEPEQARASRGNVRRLGI